MADDTVTELKAHRDIDNNRCCECGHWTDHDADCMVGRAADEIERLRAAGETLARAVATYCGDEAWADRALDAWEEARRG